jgi:hypothetical protein
VIDCVAIDQQPALDHPLLKDHAIQVKVEANIGEIEIRFELSFGSIKSIREHPSLPNINHECQLNDAISS